MPKKKLLTNIHKMAIQGMNLQGIKSDKIAAELDVPQELVDNYIKEVKSSLETIRENIANKKAGKKQKSVKNAGRESYVTKGQGGTGGVAIATKTSSERGDKKEFREYKPRNMDAVHFIDPEKQKEQQAERKAAFQKRQKAKDGQTEDEQK